MPNTTQPATLDQIKAVLAPFVGAKLNPPRDANGYALLASHCVDLHGRVDVRNADVRELTGEGVERFANSRRETIAWDDLRAVTVTEIGEMGERSYATRYELIGVAGRKAA